MTEGSPTTASPPPSSISQKRPLNINTEPGLQARVKQTPKILEDEQHVPAVSSPLNPDSAAGRARKPLPREQREKKESLKKREAKGRDNARSSTPDIQPQGKKSKNSTQTATILSPIRYKLPAPILTDFDPPKAPIFVPAFERGKRHFHECTE
ncbi:MAG: hypothetical protein Q9191_006637, partial [Dirinaria sp. TL-2023a]